MRALKRIVVSCLLIIFVLPSGCKAIKTTSASRNADFEIIVSYTNLSALQNTVYKIEGNFLKVWTDGELSYQSKISEEACLKLIAHKDALSKLSVYYDSNEIDGFVWRVMIRCEGDFDFVYLNNVCFRETNALFSTINSLLPSKVERILIEEGKCLTSRR